MSQRAGLIESDGIHIPQFLQRFAGLDNNTMPRRLPDGRHDGRRRSQHQSTWAEHHQNRHRPHHIAGEEISQHRKHQRQRYEITCRLVRHPLCRRLPRLRLTNHTDHLGDRAIISHFLRHNVCSTQVIQRPAKYRISFFLLHRHGLAGHETLVDRRFTENNFPIHRDMFPGNDAKPVPHTHLAQGNHDFLPIFQTSRHRRHQGKQFLDAPLRPVCGLLLHHFTNRHDQRHFRRREQVADTDSRTHSHGNQQSRRNPPHAAAFPQTQSRLINQGVPANRNGQPRRVKRQERQIQQIPPQKLFRHRNHIQ